MPEIPRPQYDADAEKLRKAYERALKDVQKEIKAAVKKPDDLAFLKATEGNIRNILSDINKYGEGWAEQSITKASRDGVANTLVSLGYAKTFDEALKIAAFSETNRKLTNKAIADTQKDLLAVTTNMQRQSILAVRKATSKAFAETLAKGINHSDDISRAMQRELSRYADLAIIDRAARRWKVGTYTHMIAQTKMMEAHKASTMQSAIDEGRYYGRISRHGAVDACGQWEGKIVKFEANAPGDYPFYGDLPRREIFHPNCRHIISAVRTPDDVRNLLETSQQGISSNREYITGDKIDLDSLGITAKVSNNPKLLGKLGENREDAVLSMIAESQGFDGLPKLVSKKEMDKLVSAGNAPLYRGVSDAIYTKQFREGEYFSGLGTFGNGTYAARGFSDYTTWAINEAKMYAGDNGSIMRMVLRENAKVIKEHELVFHMVNREEDLAKLIKKSKDASAINKYKAESEVIKDKGRYAATLGYDAIEYSGNFNYTVVLNRTALIVQDTDL